MGLAVLYGIVYGVSYVLSERVPPSVNTQPLPAENVSVREVFFRTLPEGETTTVRPMKFICYLEPPKRPDTLSIRVDLSNGSSFLVPTDGYSPFRVERTFERVGNYTSTCTVEYRNETYASEGLSFVVVEPPTNPFANFTE